MNVIKNLWNVIKIVYVTIMSVCGLAWLIAWHTEDGKEGLANMMKNF